jgi:hypothetical protein
MSSRQEEKQRRGPSARHRGGRSRKAARKGRLQLALGGLVALAAIALAVFVFTSRDDDGGGGAQQASAAKVDLPEQKETNLRAAAEAAQCKLSSPEIEGRDHTTDPEKWVYKTNPPTSGTHHPEWYEDGLYDPGNTPEIGKVVHTLEHGRINIQYKKGSPQSMKDALETVGSEPLQFGTEGYHVLVYENTTDMKAAVAATAWGQMLTCDRMNDQVFDAIRAFRTEYTDKGPELIP